MITIDTHHSDPQDASPQNPAIDAAMDFLAANVERQPSLEEVAAVAGMSPHHFQRTFKRWAGVSPKRFLQYLTLGHAKRLLDERASVLDAALDAGLSGPSRLHDLFVACEAVTPGEYKRRGEGLEIHFGLHDSAYGRALIGATERGICWLGFVRDGEDGSDEEILAELEGDWPAAACIHDPDATAPLAARALAPANGGGKPLPLVLYGTNFQIKVWEALLRIPSGRVASYGDIADAVGNPRAVRAVGRAVGANPISLLIPCHRVILNSGLIHNYRWGVTRKRRILAIEQARAEEDAA